ncbi:hypothetical protein PHYSODRAFT_501431 [Phytophthora sojae]|uniref:Uncharacterized protein n=1 Tax=Phytophthora sojae (strain P6497) TaxID=1094619 RepID=G4ZHZ7_PHYSP|nr:hypothetical protein PHYSODRAFT_501431 [Phytophthora sojae]EGZ17640.1 hypothetical protein PHYSODRAFT_501431 [Phytophthora sojae]|eukprot:XP_009526698.1 hypothetical protein PHYSODRAFT_501431 [Phytophthora sojae]
MPRPYLRVTFVDKQSLTIMNPKPWTCVEFGNCSYWHKTANISWWNLSSNQYANFYESSSCVSQVYFHYISDRKGYAAGLIRINKKKERFMRSMMVGKMSTVFRQPTITYVSACPKSSSGKEADNISANGCGR